MLHGILDHDAGIQDLAEHLGEQALAHRGLDEDHAVGRDRQVVLEELEQAVRDLELREPKLVCALELFDAAKARREADVVRDHDGRVQTLKVEHNDRVRVVL